MRFVQADLFPYLRDAQANGERYDVVILDPAKMTRDREQFARALGIERHRLDLEQIRDAELERCLEPMEGSTVVADELEPPVRPDVPGERAGRIPELARLLAPERGMPGPPNGQSHHGRTAMRHIRVRAELAMRSATSRPRSGSRTD